MGCARAAMRDGCACAAAIFGAVIVIEVAKLWVKRNRVRVGELVRAKSHRE